MAKIVVQAGGTLHLHQADTDKILAAISSFREAIMAGNQELQQEIQTLTDAVAAAEGRAQALLDALQTSTTQLQATVTDMQTNGSVSQENQDALQAVIDNLNGAFQANQPAPPAPPAP